MLTHILLLFALQTPAESPKSVTPPPQTAQLTDTEKLKLENFQLKNALVQQQQTQLNTDYQTFTKEVESAHPGYRLLQGTGQLVPNTSNPVEGHKFTPPPVPSTKK